MAPASEQPVGAGTMRAIVATPEGPAWTERREVARPQPGPGEAVVAVRAFAVNRGELRLVRARGGGWQPGQDIAGEVLRPAADGSGPAAGARVAGLADWHGWAEEAAVPSHRLAEVADHVDLAQAAALPMAGTTAANLVRQGGPLLGARVLVTGASGGVGHLAVQLAALGGATVTAIAAAERSDWLRSLGADTTVANVTDARGPFDLVLESVGGATLAAAIERVAVDGTLVLFGNSSREPTPIEFATIFNHQEAVLRSYFSARHEHDAGRNLRLLLGLLADGRLEVEIGLQDGWDRLNDALDALAQRRFPGKAVLLVD